MNKNGKNDDQEGDDEDDKDNHDLEEGISQEPSCNSTHDDEDLATSNS